MKNYFYLFLLILVISGLFWQRQVLVSKVEFFLKGPCDFPVGYRLGLVDKEYRVSDEDFLSKIDRATAIWERAVGKDLFAFDPKASLTISLVYTERQFALDRLEQLQDDLTDGKKALGVVEAEYEDLLRNFKSRLEALNQEVDLWNQQGGAPPEIYEGLIKRQEELRVEADRLNDMAERLNLSAEKYNAQIGKFNQSVQVYNQATLEKPEAGLYDGNAPKIDIYLTVSSKELVHTLAHEFGHAMEVEHVDDPNAIMYPFSSETLSLVAAETDALRLICEEKNWQIYSGFVVKRIQQNLMALMAVFR